MGTRRALPAALSADQLLQLNLISLVFTIPISLLFDERIFFVSHRLISPNSNRANRIIKSRQNKPHAHVLLHWIRSNDGMPSHQNEQMSGASRDAFRNGMKTNWDRDGLENHQPYATLNISVYHFSAALSARRGNNANKTRAKSNDGINWWLFKAISGDIWDFNMC